MRRLIPSSLVAALGVCAAVVDPLSSLSPVAPTIACAWAAPNGASATAATQKSGAAPATVIESIHAMSPAESREVRLSRLRERLDAILGERPLGRARSGVVVVDAAGGGVLFDHNGERAFNPASNTKILTTATALRRLGSDYRYATTLHGNLPDDDGVVHRNVELRGSGDPSLSISGIAELARDLAARGVTRITGDLVADGKFRDAAHPELAQGGGALPFNHNLFTIHVRPTEPKKNAAVSLEPSVPEYFAIDAKVTTVARKKTRLRVDRARRNGKMVIIVRGRINPRSDEKIKEHLGDGSPLAVTLLRQALLDFGVEVGGTVKTGSVKIDAPMLAVHRSSPLAEICRVANKDSNNFVAEAIWKTIGRELYGGPATADKSARAVDELLAGVGIAPGTYKFVNGSGLTHENRIQPADLARVLRYLYFDLSVAPEFLSSLAVGGIDGTIKGRFRSHDALGRVRAKTGTLANTSALSGYASDGGEVLIFSILVDGFNDRRLDEVREAQARLVRAMLAYLHAAPGNSAAPLPAAPAIEASPDAEPDSDSDGDSGTDGDTEDDEPGLGN